MEIVRLGEGVDRTGRFADDALQRTFAALEDYAAAIAGAQVERVRMVATSATRDAANRDVFIDGVRDRLGVEPDVVSGDEEAQLSFAGATAELFRGGSHWPAPYLVCDIGGGSPQFVGGAAAGGGRRGAGGGRARKVTRGGGRAEAGAPPPPPPADAGSGRASDGRHR